MTDDLVRKYKSRITESRTKAEGQKEEEVRDGGVKGEEVETREVGAGDAKVEDVKGRDVVEQKEVDEHDIWSWIGEAFEKKTRVVCAEPENLRT